jgi:hypothetical protein
MRFSRAGHTWVREGVLDLPRPAGRGCDGVPVDLPLAGFRDQGTRASLITSRITADTFERRSCGHGSKGER